MRVTIFFFIGFLIIQGVLASSENPSLPDSVKRKTKDARDTTGSFLRVNRIFIVGNRVTKEQIILREMTLKPGDVVYGAELPIIVDLDQKNSLTPVSSTRP